MTHRELKKKYETLNQQYETLLSLVIALSRQSAGPLTIERRFVEDQRHAWMIETIPAANGESVVVFAKKKAAHLAEAAASQVLQ